MNRETAQTLALAVTCTLFGASVACLILGANIAGAVTGFTGAAVGFGWAATRRAMFARGWLR